jgi:hypothetical protein
MLIYGWNSFLIRTFSAFELGLTSDFSNDFNVEVRQKYFHLFWIPFFSLGKIWCVRKGGELYDLNDDAKKQIKTANVEAKTPFYTYAGLIAIALLFIFSNIQGTTKSNDYNGMATEIAQSKKQELVTRLGKINENSYIIISNCSNPKEYSVCKIENMKNGTISLLKLDGFSNANLPNIDDVATTFNNTVELAVDVKTTADNLHKAISKNYNPLTATYKDGIDIFNNGEMYCIQYVFNLNVAK